MDESSLEGLSKEAYFESGKWGKNGEQFVDGYTYLYWGLPGQNSAQIEQQVVAIQDKGSGQFFAAPGFTVKITDPAQYRNKFLVPNPNLLANDPNQKFENGGASYGSGGDDVSAATAGLLPRTATNPPAPVQKGVTTLDIEVDEDAIEFPRGITKDNFLNNAILYAYGRYNSESDFEGNYLGEVEIRMDEYMFKPSATSIGVSWSQLTEITLDTSFNISAEEYLVSYASQEIRSALDYKAIRLAYAVAKTNCKHNPNYIYHFDAAYNTVNVGGDGTKEGYIANAQTFVSAIDAIGDVIYDEINRGGVSRLVAGPSACSYMHLNSGYSPKGKQNQTGSHQFGELAELKIA